MAAVCKPDGRHAKSKRQKAKPGPGGEGSAWHDYGLRAFRVRDGDRFAGHSVAAVEAGFAAVPRGQVEAAMSVGMTPWDILVRVRLPNALVAATPPIVNTLIVMSKETVVLSIITVPELMYQMQTMAAETFTAFDAIFAMAVFYWCLVEVVSRIGRRVEARATAFLASRP